MPAPERFVEWLTANQHVDKVYRHTYHYHPRSDAHSNALFHFVMDDLVQHCPTIAAHAASHQIAYGINLLATWESSADKKRLDLAIGTPTAPTPPPRNGEPIRKVATLSHILISCEGKAVMTEHIKAIPRLFDELSSSHEIVHRGAPDAIAAGLTVINIADSFVSPTRQHHADSLIWTRHRQPEVTAAVVAKLRMLPIRQRVGAVGFDAYATIVVNCTNQGPASLYTDPPAPRPGDPDHYLTFLERICRVYTERFRVVPEHHDTVPLAEE